MKISNIPSYLVPGLLNTLGVVLFLHTDVLILREQDYCADITSASNPIISPPDHGGFDDISGNIILLSIRDSYV